MQNHPFRLVDSSWTHGEQRRRHESISPLRRASQIEQHLGGDNGSGLHGGSLGGPWPPHHKERNGRSSRHPRRLSQRLLAFRNCRRQEPRGTAGETKSPTIWRQKRGLFARSRRCEILARACLEGLSARKQVHQAGEVRESSSELSPHLLAQGDEVV